LVRHDRCAEGAGGRREHTRRDCGGRYAQVQHRSRQAKSSSVLSGGLQERRRTRMAVATRTISVTVPDIGDFKDVPIIEVQVKPGDVVKIDDPLITLESDKASMEVPAPAAGIIRNILVKIGDRVSQGTPVVDLDPGTGDEAVAAAPSIVEEQEPEPEPLPIHAPPTPDGGASATDQVHASPSVRRL